MNEKQLFNYLDKVLCEDKNFMKKGKLCYFRVINVNIIQIINIQFKKGEKKKLNINISSYPLILKEFSNVYFVIGGRLNKYIGVKDKWFDRTPEFLDLFTEAFDSKITGWFEEVDSVSKFLEEIIIFFGFNCLISSIVILSFLYTVGSEPSSPKY